jgi:hypothetical protein
MERNEKDRKDGIRECEYDQRFDFKCVQYAMRLL